MKKTFKLNIQNKDPDQLLEKIKQEVRKYVKRERRKKLPPASDFWLFDCKFGVTEVAATEVKLRDMFAQMDAVKTEGADSFYVEILAKPGVKKPRGRLAQDHALLDEDDDLGE
jgi:Family of unknown function (DUF6172)